VTQDAVYLKLSNGTLGGKYSVCEGSSLESCYDVTFKIELKTDNIILFKSNIHSGGGENSTESYEAIKIK
jgi:hypothetical protein